MTLLRSASVLTSGLLVRKGAAVPASLALSPQQATPHPSAPQQIAPRLDAWMPPPFTPERPPRRRPPRTAGGGPSPDSTGGSAAGTPPRKKGAKLSLRLDADRHEKLRLVAFHQQRSGQQLLLAALDAYLEDCAATIMDGACTCLQRRPGS